MDNLTLNARRPGLPAGPGPSGIVGDRTASLALSAERHKTVRLAYAMPLVKALRTRAPARKNARPKQRCLLPAPPRPKHKMCQTNPGPAAPRPKHKICQTNPSPAAPRPKHKICQTNPGPAAPRRAFRGRTSDPAFQAVEPAVPRLLYR